MGVMDHSMHTEHGQTANTDGMDHVMHSMKMYFNTDLPFHLLFAPWQIDTSGKLAGACVGVFLLAIIYEAIKGVRDRLLVRNMNAFRIFNRARGNMHEGEAGPSVDSVGDGQSYDGNVVPLVQGNQHAWKSYCSLDHVLQTLMHGVQMFISYLLMLVFMTYNVYICVSLLLGSCLGYFLFFRRRFVVMGEQECCH